MIPAATDPNALISGAVPPRTAGYCVRRESVPALAAPLGAGQVVVLADADGSGLGGTGKTQLAAEFARAALASGTADVLVWADAASRDAIGTAFAGAARTGAGGADPAGTADEAAERFARWLERTRRPWLLVFDDLTDFASLDALRTRGFGGQLLVTARQPPAALSRGLTVVPVGGFSRREALEYLGARIENPDQRIEALDLCTDLGGLPLALAQAAAVITARSISCRDYRVLLGDRIAGIHGVRLPGAAPAALAAWSLAAECAYELPPAGLAWPVLALLAMLDRGGIPGAVLLSGAALDYLTGHRAASGAEAGLVRAAVLTLVRMHLVALDTGSAERTLRLNAGTQAAVRAWLPPADQDQLVVAAADALAEAWSSAPDDDASLQQVLRGCAAALCEAAPGSSPLWKPEPHPVLLRAGQSADRSGLAGLATGYWTSLLGTSIRLLGTADPSTLAARDRLAAAYAAAGQAADAVALLQLALAERERNLGADHAETFAARGRLAAAYQEAGRPVDAVALYERMAADAVRVLGASSPAAFAARRELATALTAAGRLPDAITTLTSLVRDTERALGPANPATISARTTLAEVCTEAGQHRPAADHYRAALAAAERGFGPDHQDTIAIRAGLAAALRRAGRVKDAVPHYQRVLVDRARAQGADHVETIAASANLAYAYRLTGQFREATECYEQALAGFERVLGPEHADTRAARRHLAAAYQQAGRTADAIDQYTRAVADAERVLGGGDLETITTRCTLAAAYHAAGQLTHVVSELASALEDCERFLGPDHEMTATVRENLAAASQA